MMNRIIVGPLGSSKNDFIAPLGSAYVFRILSAEPKEIPNYLTIVAPFDRLTWALLVASILAAFIALVVIDIAFAKWTKTSTRGILLQSNHIP